MDQFDSTSASSDLSPHHCGRCGSWHQGTCAPAKAQATPWTVQPNTERVPPRECIRAARDALNRAYGISAPTPKLWMFMAEALDWQRRALEQIAEGIEEPPPRTGQPETRG